jgi:hypothetical protein
MRDVVSPTAIIEGKTENDRIIGSELTSTRTVAFSVHPTPSWIFRTMVYNPMAVSGEVAQTIVLEFAPEHPLGSPEYVYETGAVPPEVTAATVNDWFQSTWAELESRLAIVGSGRTVMGAVKLALPSTLSVTVTSIVKFPVERVVQLNEGATVRGHPPGSPVELYERSPVPPLTRVTTVNIWPASMAPGFTTRPVTCGGAFTVNWVVAWLDEYPVESVTVRLTVKVPFALGRQGRTERFAGAHPGGSPE